METNPYKLGTQKYKTLNTLSNLKWHCSICDLPGSQPAAIIRDLRRKGFEIETASIKCGGGPKNCEKCGEKTTHYRLVDIKPINSPIERSNLPNWLVNRIFKIYDFREAITNRKRHPKDLTIDHRIPNIRWNSSEEQYTRDIKDKEIVEKFQLLTNEDNLWKSRMCERCKDIGIRQPFLDINYFYKGDEIYDSELGCDGCGWFNPQIWKELLNKLIIK